MSAMTFSTQAGNGDADALVAKLRAKMLPLAVVGLIHAALFFLIYSGMLTRMVDAVAPQAVMVKFITPQPAPPSEPVLPKTVTVAQLPPMIVPPVPVVQIAIQNTITVPQAAAAVAEKTPAAAPVAAVVAPPAPPVTGPKTLTSGVEYIQQPQPVYPKMSLRMREQGKVVLRVLINEKGLPDQVVVQTSSGSARLDEAGRQAALRALFKPHVEDGRATAVYALVPVNFSLS